MRAVLRGKILLATAALWVPAAVLGQAVPRRPRPIRRLRLRARRSAPATCRTSACPGRRPSPPISSQLRPHANPHRPLPRPFRRRLPQPRRRAEPWRAVRQRPSLLLRRRPSQPRHRRRARLPLCFRRQRPPHPFSTLRLPLRRPRYRRRRQRAWRRLTNPRFLPWLIAALALAGGVAFLLWRRRPRQAYAGAGEHDLFTPEPRPQPQPELVPRRMPEQALRRRGRRLAMSSPLPSKLPRGSSTDRNRVFTPASLNRDRREAAPLRRRRRPGHDRVRARAVQRRDCAGTGDPCRSEHHQRQRDAGQDLAAFFANASPTPDRARRDRADEADRADQPGGRAALGDPGI